MNLFKRIYIHIPEVHKLVRSFIFCFRYLPFKEAIKMPIFLEQPIKVCRLKRGNIVFEGEIGSRQVEFVSGVCGFPALKSEIYVEPDCKIVFRGKAYFSRGSSLRVDNGGMLEFGKDFVTNRNTIIRCSDNIVFKDDVMVGWNNEINDCDGHPVYIDGVKTQGKAPIVIGPHVWITTYVRISKGVTIPHGCVVAKGAIVSKKHETPNALIGGVPAKDIRTGVDWSRH